MAKRAETEEQKRKREIWKQHIANYSKSGSSQAQYCRQHNLSAKLFTYWKRKFRRKSSVSFVPVQVKPETEIAAAGESEVVLCKYGYRIEVKEGFNPVVLEKVLKTIREL